MTKPENSSIRRSKVGEQSRLTENSSFKRSSFQGAEQSFNSPRSYCVSHS
jgi:hypothetical protein